MNGLTSISTSSRFDVSFDAGVCVTFHYEDGGTISYQIPTASHDEALRLAKEMAASRFQHSWGASS